MSTVLELKLQLSEYGLRVSGRKAELQDRLDKAISNKLRKLNEPIAVLTRPAPAFHVYERNNTPDITWIPKETMLYTLLPYLADKYLDLLSLACASRYWYRVIKQVLDAKASVIYGQGATSYCFSIEHTIRVMGGPAGNRGVLKNALMLTGKCPGNLVPYRKWVIAMLARWKTVDAYTAELQKRHISFIRDSKWGALYQRARLIKAMARRKISYITIDIVPSIWSKIPALMTNRDPNGMVSYYADRVASLDWYRQIMRGLVPLSARLKNIITFEYALCKDTGMPSYGVLHHALTAKKSDNDIIACVQEYQNMYEALTDILVAFRSDAQRIPYQQDWWDDRLYVLCQHNSRPTAIALLTEEISGVQQRDNRLYNTYGPDIYTNIYFKRYVYSVNAAVNEYLLDKTSTLKKVNYALRRQGVILQKKKKKKK